MTKTRDADVLGLLVFLQRFGLNTDNGRRQGRAFLSALREAHPPAAEASDLPVLRDPALTRRRPHQFHQAGALLAGAHHCPVNLWAR